VIDTTQLIDNLWFNYKAHTDKSVFIPTQELDYLGFTLISKTMRVTVTPGKKLKLIETCKELLTKEYPTIREVARVIGLLISNFPGVAMGPLYYRLSEADKIAALKHNKGKFDATMQLSAEAKEELVWWIHNIDTAFNPVHRGKPNVTIQTYASKLGWGCRLADKTTGGLWAQTESYEHINYLETLAVFLSLKSFRHILSGNHVMIMVVNTTAESIIREMGTSHSAKLNQLVKHIWQWCEIQKIWITMAHIPGVENCQADFQSRSFNWGTEWCLNKDIFTLACNMLRFTPDIDQFASRIKYQFKPYVAFRPDPEAIAINAFHMTWVQFAFYAFPPFSVIMQVLQKIQEDQASGILVIPYWPTQIWWPKAMNMIFQQPIVLPKSKELLSLPNQPNEIHPMYPKLCLLICHLSGISSQKAGIFGHSFKSHPKLLANRDKKAICLPH
jgi:hypothetical protein